MNSLTQAGNYMTSIKRKINWQWVKKALTVVFFIALAYLMFTKAREQDWAKVWETFTKTDPTTLATAFGFGILCYTAYASYDLIGRHLFKVKIPAFKTLTAAWISYACNLNLGAVIGSVALRYRLYSRLGVKASTVTQIISISVFSNWTGYVLLAGILFVSGVFTPPESWAIGSTGFRILGALFVLLVLAYVCSCAFLKQREFTLREHTLVLPKLPIVAWQLGTAVVHWSLMALVMYQFFSDDFDFATIYIALLVSCIAGAVSHVPGGLGVIEAVFVALLAGQVPKHEILAAVFAYRTVFYLIPLAITLPLYLIFETVLAEKKDAEA